MFIQGVKGCELEASYCHCLFIFLAVFVLYSIPAGFYRFKFSNCCHRDLHSQDELGQVLALALMFLWTFTLMFL